MRLKTKNREKLDRLNLPSLTGRGVKLLIFDQYTPYKADVLPDMKTLGLKDREGAHGFYCGQIIRMVAPEVELHGCGYTSKLDTVIDCCMESNIKIISASITYSKSTEKEKTLKRYYDWGGVYVAPAGNDDSRGVKYPGTSPYTICVSATNTPDCNGPEIDVTADSWWHVRNLEPDFYHSFNGTSASVPVIAGCVALLLEKHPEWGCEQVREFLKTNSGPLKEEYERFFSFPNVLEEGEKMQLRKGEIKFAVIHHSAKLNKYTAEEVLKVHKARGFATYGYNVLIEPDGKVVQGRDPKYRGAHTLVSGDDPQYWNENALGFCLVWNGEEKEFPDVMYRSLAKQLREYGFTKAEIRLHREVDATKCPGKHFDKSKLFTYLEREWGESMTKKDYEGHYHEYDIEMVKRYGLMSGYSENKFKPDEPVTRAELAAVIRRLVEMYIKEVL